MMTSAWHAPREFARAGEAVVRAYVFLRQAAAANSWTLHNPHYDFDDRLVPISAGYWRALVQQELPLE